MPDPIGPPVARRPEEALELAAQALSDGDLEAALAQYESSAALAYWPRCRPRGDDSARSRGEPIPPDAPGGTPRGGWPRGDEPQSPPGTPRGPADGTGNGDGDVRSTLTCVMALRLPLSVRITSVLESPELALVICERRVAGTGPDGEQVRLNGHGCAVLRPQPDGAWRIAADAWRVGTERPLDPPDIPPGTNGDPVPGEGQGGQSHL